MNIYTPTLDVEANLDVIIFIHGGAFMFNYGGFQGPELLLDRQIVYINFNYRLGPLGKQNLHIGNNNRFHSCILANLLYPVAPRWAPTAKGTRYHGYSG